MNSSAEPPFFPAPSRHGLPSAIIFNGGPQTISPSGRSVVASSPVYSAGLEMRQPGRNVGAPHPTSEAPREEEAAAPMDEVSGDTRTAIADAYRKHSQLVYRIALRYGRGRTSFADDVTQDVFLQLWKHAAKLTERHALEGWLYTAATRRCLTKLRNERVIGLFTLQWLREEGEPQVDGNALYGAREELRRALAALSELPDKERVAFSMFHLDGKSQEEICTVLGHSKGYVSKLIQRATETLSKLGWEVSP